ncbi:hypothetical protein [Microvirga arabica]|uniref:hypothetical protein n=1 Tax=Microvirga arabica TaxID=1128671 RepID=UPI0019398387|nr:hypothetical protein [Microvirga arabica]MBM1174809.1 hypothetical protein [Microvirga arabica]
MAMGPIFICSAMTAVEVRSSKEKGEPPGMQVNPEGTTGESPAVTTLSNGGWVVTWRSYDSETDHKIFQRHFDKDGKASSSINTEVNASREGGQSVPKVVSLSGGGWLVTWQAQDLENSDIRYLYQQAYDAKGQPLFKSGGNPVDAKVDAPFISMNGYYSVAALNDGGWIFTWGADVSGAFEIYQQRYSASGAVVGSATLVNTTTLGDQGEPSVTALPDGGWLVTWTSFNRERSEAEIYQQRFTAAGEKIGPTTPTGLLFSAQQVEEGASSAAPAGTLNASALVASHNFTYTLLDDAGGRFFIDGNQIKVKDGIRLDYKQAVSHQVTVQVRDSAGEIFTTSVTIAVSDVASEKLTGSAGADVLKGGTGKDTFSGGAGNGTVWGGAGNDALKGDGGRDVFVFATKANAKTNKDKILDFKVKDDSFWLDNAVFTKLGKKGTEATPAQLKKDFFTVGSKAKDKNDYIVYDKAKGVLFYDADGSGKGKQVEIATLSKKLAMTHKDFFVI